METNINPADITRPATPSESPRICQLSLRVLLSSFPRNSVSSNHTPIPPLKLLLHPHRFGASSAFLLGQAVPSSSPQFTSLPAPITALGQAVHYFKFTACPPGLPRGGITSGFGWRGDLQPKPRAPPLTLLQFNIKSYQIKFHK